MKVDKTNGYVKYNDEKHLYWDDNDGRYISVTTLIGKFEHEFDKDFWSSYKALEKLIPVEGWKLEKPRLLTTKRFNKEILNIYSIDESSFIESKQAILDQWAEENRISCERGTKIHAGLEESMCKPEVTLEKYDIGGKFTYKKDHYKLDLEKGVYPEFLIHYKTKDGLLKLAGQVDLLIKDGNHITIVDYKGLPLNTKIITQSGWSTIGELKIGDKIFDEDGEITTVIHKSNIHTNPCYKIIFDNGDDIVADHEHRWKIAFRKNKKNYFSIMTTEQLYEYLQTYTKNSETIPKIINPKPINTKRKNLLIDPYVLGVWLGDGSKSCGVVTQQKNSPLWDEIIKRGYELSPNLQHTKSRENTEIRTIYGLRSDLVNLNILNNKHIPEEYFTSSIEQRLDLLRGLMDTDGYYHKKRKRFVMNTGQEWQRDDLVRLLGTLGIKSTVFSVVSSCNGKKFPAWNVCFSTNSLNPFLTRNQEIEFPKMDKNSFRNIIKVEKVNTIPTQCIEVDSPKHTFLFSEKCIVTHNTNKKLDQKSYFDTTIKGNTKMKYPLNNIMDCNFLHYTLQLSTYAWMVQQLNSEFIIDRLIIIHYDHSDKVTKYDIEYKKDDVIRMLKYHKYKSMVDKELDKVKRIEY